jgi:hypothetical protein
MLRGIAKKGYARFVREFNLAQRLIIYALLAFLIICVFAALSDARDSYNFNHLDASEHLRLARVACASPQGNAAAECRDPIEAQHQLDAISKTAPEYTEAAALLTAIRLQSQQADLRMTEDAQRTSAQRQQYGREQMQRNFQGLAHDEFTCDRSTDDRPIISFDGRQTWWFDDGRCALQLQKKRDSDAEVSSYWSTTLRVDTDMNSSWLPDEERTCRTYPDEKGRVASIVCGETGSHPNHNIPVKFWGGIDRGAVSNWKCTRTSDGFVCRAID